MKANGQAAPTVTTGTVARQLGMRVQAVHEAIADGLVAPTVPPRKQGSPAKWSGEDIAVLQAGIACRAHVARMAPVVAQAGQRLRSARAGTVLAVGALGVRPVRGGETVGDLIRLLGSPLVLVSRVG